VSLSVSLPAFLSERAETRDETLRYNISVSLFIEIKRERERERERENTSTTSKREREGGNCIYGILTVAAFGFRFSEN
jgi:hypothetical protein